MNPYQAPDAALADPPLSVREKPSPIQQYWAWWKRGWWLQLLIFVFNLGLAILIVPFAFLFSKEQALYFASAFASFLAFGLPFGGWLYDKFASATHEEQS